MPSLQPRFSLKVMGMTDRKRKVTNQAKPIQRPKAKTAGSVMSMCTALMEDLCRACLSVGATISLNPLYRSSPVC